jgi:hypothetical protein
MSQSDYIYHKKIRNILSNPNMNDLDTVLTNKDYVQYKQYTSETKSAQNYDTNKQKDYNKLNMNNTSKISFRNMDITICQDTSCNNYTCKLCRHNQNRPTKQSFSRGSTVISRNTYNQYFNLQKKAMLSQTSLKLNGVIVQPLDPSKDFCKCDRYFYNKNMYTTRDSRDEYFQKL